MRLQPAAIIVLLSSTMISMPASADVAEAVIERIHGLGAFNQRGIIPGNPVNDPNPGCGQAHCVDICAKLPLGSSVDAVEPFVRAPGYEWAICWRHKDHQFWDCNAEHFRFYPGEPNVLVKEGQTWVCMQGRNWHQDTRELRLKVTYHVPGAAAQAASPPAAGPARATSYRVVRGDTLWDIALKLHVGPGWQRLYGANRGLIRDPDLIFPGQILAVP